MLQRMDGFTLIELVVVLTVISLLAVLGWPSYQEHRVRSHRLSAQAQMLEIASRQQQFLLTQGRYASQEQLEASGYQLPDALQPLYAYRLSLSSTPPAYTLYFTPRPGSAQFADAPLSLGSDGQRTPPDRW